MAIHEAGGDKTPISLQNFVPRTPTKQELSQDISIEVIKTFI